MSLKFWLIENNIYTYHFRAIQTVFEPMSSRAQLRLSLSSQVELKLCSACLQHNFGRTLLKYSIRVTDACAIYLLHNFDKLIQFTFLVYMINNLLSYTVHLLIIVFENFNTSKKYIFFLTLPRNTGGKPLGYNKFNQKYLISPRLKHTTNIEVSKLINHIYQS